ncbi:MAG: hypothetical protein OHK93_001124 [Ramalina farinacea]|uniref:Uncharacterized protein n=1 Tax=Ramalina farinacea TaxID=258253 RepID=A0AA43QNX4_9LECA|nr:hypothetical protein [Ramalina farinacea]
MPRSLPQNILASTRELLLPMTMPELLNSFPLILTIFVFFADPERLRTIFPPLHYLTLGMVASTILYVVLGMGVMFTISLSLVDTALSVRLSTPELCLWLVLSECLIAMLDRYAGKPIFNMNAGKPRSISEWFHQQANKPRMKLQRFYSQTIRMAAGTFQWMFAPLYYSFLGLTGAAILSLVLGKSSAIAAILLGLRDTALLWRPSIPVFCLCLLLEACRTAIFVRHPLTLNGGKPRFMSRWLTQLARRPLTNLQHLLLKTKKLAARICQRLKPRTKRSPQLVPVAPEGREHRLQRWEDDLQELEIDLRETEDDLRSWDKDLRERDDNLRELERALREWEDGLREALQSMEDQAEGVCGYEE